MDRRRFLHERTGEAIEALFKDRLDDHLAELAHHYGHSANTWKEIVRAYMETGYEGILSVENEDPILSGEVGVERALYVLKNVRAELLNSNAP